MKSTKEIHDRLSAVLVSMGANAAFVEEMFQDYLNNPASVAASWRNFFAEITGSGGGGGGGGASAVAQPRSKLLLKWFRKESQMKNLLENGFLVS